MRTCPGVGTIAPQRIRAIAFPLGIPPFLALTRPPRAPVAPANPLATAMPPQDPPNP